MATLIPNYDLAQKIGTSKVEIEAATVGELIREATTRFGEPFTTALKSATIMVNGRSVSRLQGERTPIARDDTLWLIVPSGGG